MLVSISSVIGSQRILEIGSVNDLVRLLINRVKLLQWARDSSIFLCYISVIIIYHFILIEFTYIVDYHKIKEQSICNILAYFSI